MVTDKFWKIANSVKSSLSLSLSLSYLHLSTNAWRKSPEYNIYFSIYNINMIIYKISHKFINNLN